MNPTAAIHVAKKQLGLDDDDYRALLQRVTGKASSRDMSPAERGRVLDEFKRMGFELVRSPYRPEVKGADERRPRVKGALDLVGPYVPKMRALWISGWRLGVIKDRTDTALAAFVRAQTGIDHVSWVRDPRDSKKAVEALKKWLSREAGVVWPGTAPKPSETKRAVIAAQLAILGLPAEGGAKIFDLDTYIAELGAQIRKARK